MQLWKHIATYQLKRKEINKERRKNKRMRRFKMNNYIVNQNQYVNTNSLPNIFQVILIPCVRNRDLQRNINNLFFGIPLLA